MGEKRVGYKDWDDIVKAKEESLIVINANKRSLEVGEVVEKLVLERALKERAKYPKPKEENIPKTLKNATD